jgi:hypothetical protein
MDHLTEAELQAWIDRELDRDEHARVSRHLEDCPACRSLLGELRAAAETFSGAMLRYDEDLAAGTGRTQTERRSAARRWPRWASRAAAVVLLLGAAAAAAMVPGSPFRALFTEPAAPAVEILPESGSAVDSPVEAGASITVKPLDGRLTVRVTEFPAGTRVLLRLSDLPDAMASLPDGAANARFIVSSGTLEVVGPGEADDPSDGPLVLRLPRSLASGVVELEDTAVARVSDGRLITLRQVSRTGDEAVLEIGG